MKARMVGLGLLAAAVLTACGGSSAPTSAPAASSAASSAASASSSATEAAGGATSAAPTSTIAATTGSNGGTCKYLSDADAATLLPNAGQAKVTAAETPAGNVTSCLWGAGLGQTNRMILLVSELKIDAAVADAKGSIDSIVTEKITGLGDSGGYSDKGPDSGGVAFIKGKTMVILTVATAGVKADVLAALAKKIAGSL